MEQEIIELTDEVQEEAPPEIPEIATEVIDRAKGMGWIPEEEFRGDKKRWRPADEYVQRADEMLPIMKSQMTKYETKIGTLEAKLESQAKTSEKLLKMSERVGQESYERARKDITRQQVQAVADGDVESWQRFEDQKDELKPPEPITPEEPVEEPLNPAFKPWHDKNDWYLSDEDLTDFANMYSNKINPGGKMDAAELYAKVEQKVKSAFPHKFANPNRANPSPVDSPSLSGTEQPTGGKTYADLPEDAKKQARVWVADGTFKTKEDYAKSYFEED